MIETGVTWYGSPISSKKILYGGTFYKELNEGNDERDLPAIRSSPSQKLDSRSDFRSIVYRMKCSQRWGLQLLWVEKEKWIRWLVLNVGKGRAWKTDHSMQKEKEKMEGELGRVATALNSFSKSILLFFLKTRKLRVFYLAADPRKRLFPESAGFEIRLRARRDWGSSPFPRGF